MARCGKPRYMAWRRLKEVWSAGIPVPPDISLNVKQEKAYILTPNGFVELDTVRLLKYITNWSKKWIRETYGLTLISENKTFGYEGLVRACKDPLTAITEVAFIVVEDPIYTLFNTASIEASMAIHEYVAHQISVGEIVYHDDAVWRVAYEDAQSFTLSPCGYWHKYNEEKTLLRREDCIWLPTLEELEKITERHIKQDVLNIEGTDFVVFWGSEEFFSTPINAYKSCPVEALANAFLQFLSVQYK